MTNRGWAHHAWVTSLATVNGLLPHYGSPLARLWPYLLSLSDPNRRRPLLDPQLNRDDRCGASLGGAVDYILNPTLRLKKQRVFVRF